MAEIIGYEGKVVNLLASKEHFQTLIVVSDIWKNFGYGSILYIATISGIDQQLYEAATIDGAGKLIYGIPTKSAEGNKAYMMAVRKDWLDNLGIHQHPGVYGKRTGRLPVEQRGKADCI